MCEWWQKSDWWNRSDWWQPKVIPPPRWMVNKVTADAEQAAPKPSAAPDVAQDAEQAAPGPLAAPDVVQDAEQAAEPSAAPDVAQDAEQAGPFFYVQDDDQAAPGPSEAPYIYVQDAIEEQDPVQAAWHADQATEQNYTALNEYIELCEKAEKAARKEREKAEEAARKEPSAATIVTPTIEQQNHLRGVVNRLNTASATKQAKSNPFQKPHLPYPKGWSWCKPKGAVDPAAVPSSAPSSPDDPPGLGPFPSAEADDPFPSAEADDRSVPPDWTLRRFTTNTVTADPAATSAKKAAFVANPLDQIKLEPIPDTSRLGLGPRHIYFTDSDDSDAEEKGRAQGAVVRKLPKPSAPPDAVQDAVQAQDAPLPCPATNKVAATVEPAAASPLKFPPPCPATNKVAATVDPAAVPPLKFPPPCPATDKVAATGGPAAVQAKTRPKSKKRPSEATGSDTGPAAKASTVPWETSRDSGGWYSGTWQQGTSWNESGSWDQGSWSSGWKWSKH
jgi:hypothetical protein